MELKLTPEKLNKIEIGLDQFVYLWLKSNNLEYKKDYSVNLIMDGLMNPSGVITAKGKKVLEDVLGKEIKKVVDYSEIMTFLKNVMKKHTGKEQLEGFGGVYFRPTETELKQFLERFWKQYPKYTDIVKIKAILESHIQKCRKKNSFAPAIKYFIIKEQSKGTYVSQLASAYENFNEQEQQIKPAFEL